MHSTYFLPAAGHTALASFRRAAAPGATCVVANGAGGHVRLQRNASGHVISSPFALVDDADVDMDDELETKVITKAKEEHPADVGTIFGDGLVPVMLYPDGPPSDPVEDILETVGISTKIGRGYYDFQVTQRSEAANPRAGYQHANFVATTIPKTGIQHHKDKQKTTLVHRITFDPRQRGYRCSRQWTQPLMGFVSGYSSTTLSEFGPAALYMLCLTAGGNKVLYVIPMYNRRSVVGSMRLAVAFTVVREDSGHRRRIYALPQTDSFMLQNTLVIPAVPEETTRKFDDACTKHVQQKLGSAAGATAARAPPRSAAASPTPQPSVPLLETSNQTPYVLVCIGDVTPPPVLPDAPRVYISGNLMSLTPFASPARNSLCPSTLLALLGKELTLQTDRVLVAVEADFAFKHRDGLPPVVLCMRASEIKDSLRQWMTDFIQFERVFAVFTAEDGPGGDEGAEAVVQRTPLNALGCGGRYSLFAVQHGRQVLGVETMGFGKYLFSTGENVAPLLLRPDLWQAHERGGDAIIVGPGLRPVGPPGHDSLEAATRALPQTASEYIDASGAAMPTVMQLHRVMRAAARAGEVAMTLTRTALTPALKAESERLHAQSKRLHASVRRALCTGAAVEQLKSASAAFVSAKRLAKRFDAMVLGPVLQLRLQRAGRTSAQQQLRSDAADKLAAVAEKAFASPQAMADFLGELEDTGDDGHEGFTVSLDVSRPGYPTVRSGFEHRSDVQYEVVPYAAATLAVAVTLSPHASLPMVWKEAGAHGESYTAYDSYDDSDGDMSDGGHGGGGHGGDSHVFQFAFLFAPELLAVGPYCAVETNTAYESKGAELLGVMRRAIRQMCATPEDGAETKAAGLRAVHFVLDVLDLLWASCPPSSADALPACPTDTLPGFRRALFRLAMSLCGAGKAAPMSTLWQYTDNSKRAGEGGYCSEEWRALQRFHRHRAACDQRGANGGAVDAWRATAFVMGRMNRVAENEYIARHDKTQVRAWVGQAQAHNEWVTGTKWVEGERLAHEAASGTELTEARKFEARKTLRYNSRNHARWTGLLTAGEHGHVGLKASAEQHVVAERKAGEKLSARDMLQLRAYDKLRKQLRLRVNNNKAMRELAAAAECPWPQVSKYQAKGTAAGALPTLSRMAEPEFQAELQAFAEASATAYNDFADATFQKMVADGAGARGRPAAPLAEPPAWNVWKAAAAVPPPAPSAGSAGSDDDSGDEAAVPTHQTVVAMAQAAASTLYTADGSPAADFDAQICAKLDIPPEVARQILLDAQVESLPVLMQALHTQYELHGPACDRLDNALAAMRCDDDVAAVTATSELAVCPAAAPAAAAPVAAPTAAAPAAAAPAVAAPAADAPAADAPAAAPAAQQPPDVNRRLLELEKVFLGIVENSSKSVIERVNSLEMTLHGAQATGPLIARVVALEGLYGQQ
jgi:hypothetical protein